VSRSELRQRIINHVGASVEQKSIGAGGVETTYLEAGAGQPVVLLHGGNSTGGIAWYPVIGSLAIHFRVLIPDIVGYGESQKPAAPYNRAYFMSWMHSFLDALNLGQICLIAASMSGAVAIELALRYPEQLENLVLVNSVGLSAPPRSAGLLLSMVLYTFFPSPLTSWLQTRHVMYKFDRKVALQDEAMYALGLYGIEVARLQESKRMMMRAGRAKIMEPIPPERLKGMATPTLLLWGAEDHFWTAAEAQQAAHVMPNARFRAIPEAGHLPYLEQPNAFAEAVIPFLSGVPAR
jgi:pimeloyl-ACP methyl ester carboxylesterase